MAVRFVDQSPDGYPLAEICEFAIDNGIAPPSAVGLGASVSRQYREALAARSSASGAVPWPPLVEDHDPDEVWASIAGSQKFGEPIRIFESGGELPAKETGAVRFVCISDTHGRHAELTSLLPDGDVLLHAGDFTMTGGADELGAFGKWLAGLPYPRKILISGNHDITLHEEYYESVGKWRFHSSAPLDPAEARRRFLEACGETVTYL